jgi:D-arabinose 1-dehydrogenase-like Zn-dependent alcohol dehydrogenase
MDARLTPTVLEERVRAAAGGDKDAARAVLDAIQDGIYGLCLRMLGHPADAEDAAPLGVHVLATTRSRDKLPLLAALGADPLLETAGLVDEVRARFAGGVDGVVDILGCSTVLESCRMVRYRGRVAIAGFLAGAGP